jgi:predicted DNA binding CopG/RHH family protein
MRLAQALVGTRSPASLIYREFWIFSVNAIAKWEDVPIFDSEVAEADFWAENRPDLRLMESAVATSSDSAESVTITLRIDPRMLARIKRLARSRYLNYQSMIKQWLSERMEHELRER